MVFYGNPDFYWGYDNADVTRLIAEAEEAATEDEHTASRARRTGSSAEDAASNWFFLYPQIVVSQANVTGYPLNGLNSQFFLRGIEKSN